MAERGGVANRERLKQLYPARDILPFARRRDPDDVACLVRRDPEYPRRSVLVIHEDAMPGYEIDEVIGSLAEWLRQAQNEFNAHMTNRV